MTPVDELAEVRARLESMVELAEAATTGSWYVPGDWCLSEAGSDADAAYMAAASPDLLLRVAQEAIYVLNRHEPNFMGDCMWCGFAWPCVDVAGVLKAWQP